MKLTKQQRKERRAHMLANLKSFAAAVVSWFKNVEKKMDEVLPEIIDISLKVMNFIKKGSESKFIDLVLEWIPGDQDKALRGNVISALEKTIDLFIEGKECLDKPTLEEKIECFFHMIKEQNSATQFGILQQFHATFIKEVNPDKMSLSEASYIASKYHLGQNLMNIA